jgi:hypothetical protein
MQLSDANIRESFIIRALSRQRSARPGPCFTYRISRVALALPYGQNREAAGVPSLQPQ